VQCIGNHCLSFGHRIVSFDLRLLITPLVSYNFADKHRVIQIQLLCTY
jgi:hypothetical protein